MKTVIIWLLTIFIISIYPTDKLPEAPKFSDLAVHAFLYCLTCALFYTVMREGKKPSPLTRHPLVWAVALSAGYGYMMEIAQGALTTTRHYSLADAGANLAGSLLWAAFILVRQPRRRR